MFEIFALLATYAVVTFVMSFLPHPDGGIIIEILRWALFIFGSWTAIMLFSHIKRVATDFHSMTIGRPDLDNLPDWAFLDDEGNIQTKDKM